VGARDDEFSIIDGEIGPDILGELSIHTTIVITLVDPDLIVLLTMDARIANQDTCFTMSSEVVFDLKCHSDSFSLRLRLPSRHNKDVVMSLRKDTILTNA
jgi:hypothetical protein